jgi:hypothetical protein
MRIYVLNENGEVRSVALYSELTQTRRLIHGSFSRVLAILTGQREILVCKNRERAYDQYLILFLVVSFWRFESAPLKKTGKFYNARYYRYTGTIMVELDIRNLVRWSNLNSQFKNFQ